MSNCFSRHAAQIVVGLFLGTLSGPSVAEPVSKDRVCFELWQDQVAEVSSAFSEGLPSNEVIYFIGSDGSTFDCLGFKAPKYILAEREHWARQIAPLADEMAREDKTLSTTFCNLSEQKLGSYLVVGVHLPYEREKLNSADCQRRILNLPSRIQEKLQ